MIMEDDRPNLHANTYAAQLNWPAMPALYRTAKLFSGRPHGTIPTTQAMSYSGLGWIPFRGLIVRALNIVNAVNEEAAV